MSKSSLPVVIFSSRSRSAVPLDGHVPQRRRWSIARPAVEERCAGTPTGQLTEGYTNRHAKLCILLYSLGDAAATGFQCLKSRQLPYVCTIFDHIPEFRLFWVARWIISCRSYLPIIVWNHRAAPSGSKAVLAPADVVSHDTFKPFRTDLPAANVRANDADLGVDQVLDCGENRIFCRSLCSGRQK